MKCPAKQVCKLCVNQMCMSQSGSFVCGGFIVKHRVGLLDLLHQVEDSFEFKLMMLALIHYNRS